LDCLLKNYIIDKPNLRSLNINFDLYTDNDPEFKKELIGLVINDLKELQASCSSAITIHDPEIYRSTCHKIVSTLSMINDQEFADAIEALKTQNPGEDQVTLFNKLSDEIIKSLKYECEMIK
ncbi:MAG TPA: hypothetical protein VIM65_05765, partial [Cyclobacteriaceae bacterium]